MRCEWLILLCCFVLFCFFMDEVLLSCCLQDSFFVFDFWQFDYNVFQCESLWVYPTWGLLNLLMNRLIFSSCLRTWGHFFLHVFFKYSFFPLLFPGTTIVSHWCPWICSFIFNCFFFFFSNRIISNNLCSLLLILPFLWSNLFLSPSGKSPF